jgi:hypothetical protein
MEVLRVEGFFPVKVIKKLNRFVVWWKETERF